ncbi:hypothetical protein GF380_05645, partial [Candidatus Uhrbacteria bacterium]|nr:hypothetical protein [Candidatus Uhrbacteria bacterium]MBD3284675.1 hypothetical protein [Candidatus Uhrbacteria bacterium]
MSDDKNQPNKEQQVGRDRPADPEQRAIPEQPPKERVPSDQGELKKMAQSSIDLVDRGESDFLQELEEDEAGLAATEAAMGVGDPQRMAQIREASGYGDLGTLRAASQQVAEQAKREMASVANAPLPVEVPTTAPVAPAETPESVEQTEPSKQTEQREQREGFDPVLERVKRHLKLAQGIEAIREGSETPEQRQMLAGALEGRGWHKIFHNVEPGDAIVAVMTPPGGETYHQSVDERYEVLQQILDSNVLEGVYHSAEDVKQLEHKIGFDPFGVFGVKRGNDDFFGPQLMDEIILK